AGTAADCVGLEAGAVVDVEDVDLLGLEEGGGCHQRRVEGDRPDVVEVRAGHGGPVDLGLHHGPLHYAVCSSATTPRSVSTSAPVAVIARLSMRRVRPTKAATARNWSPSTRAAGSMVCASTSSA